MLSVSHTEGGTQQSFIQGGSVPRSNPLPFNIPFLTENVPRPFIYLLLKNGTPFTYLVENFGSLARGGTAIYGLYRYVPL